MSHNSLRPVVSPSSGAKQAHFCLLGEFAITHAGEPYCPNFSKRRIARNLVQLLGASDTLTVPRSVVIESLWPGNSEDTVTNRLHQTIHWIRGEFKSLPSELRPAIQVEGDHLTLLLPQQMSLDVQTALHFFDCDLDGEERLTALREVIALTRSELCPDWLDDHRIEARRQQLKNIRRESLEEAVQLSEELEATSLTIEMLDELCQESDSSLEHQTRMAHALVRQGRIDRAIAFCLKVREQWQKEDPSEVVAVNELLTELQRQANKTTNNSDSDHLPNLPVNDQLHRFTNRHPSIGVDDIVDEVVHICRSNIGLITAITGVAGCGKTAVASKVADQIQAEFRNGAIYLNCRDVCSTDELTKLLINAIDVDDTPDDTTDEQLLVSWVESTELLFFLDDLYPSATLTGLLTRLSRANSENRWLITCPTIPSFRGGRSYVIDSTRLLVESRDRTISALQMIRWHAKEHWPANPSARAQLVTLANQVNGLPVALKALGQLLSIRSPAELLGNEIDLCTPECEELQSVVLRTSDTIDELPSESRSLLSRLSARKCWLTQREICALSTEKPTNDIVPSLDRLVRDHLLIRQTEDLGENLVSVYRVNFVTRLAIQATTEQRQSSARQTDRKHDMQWLLTWPEQFNQLSASVVAHAFDLRIVEFDRVIQDWLVHDEPALLIAACQRFEPIWACSNQKMQILQWLNLAESATSLNEVQRVRLLTCRASIDSANRQIPVSASGEARAESKRGMEAGFKLMSVATCAVEHADFASAAMMLDDAHQVFDSFGLHYCSLSAQKERAQVAMTCADLDGASACAQTLEKMASDTGNTIHQLWAELIRVELALSQGEFESVIFAATVLSGRAESSGIDEISCRALRAIAWTLFALNAYRLCDESCEQLLTRLRDQYPCALTIDVHLLAAMSAARQGNTDLARRQTTLASQMLKHSEVRPDSETLYLAIADIALGAGCAPIALDASNALVKNDTTHLKPYDQTRLESVRKEFANHSLAPLASTRSAEHDAAELLTSLAQSLSGHELNAIHSVS